MLLVVVGEARDSVDSTSPDVRCGPGALNRLGATNLQSMVNIACAMTLIKKRLAATQALAEQSSEIWCLFFIADAVAVPCEDA